jgi:hypothetical protein
MQENWIPLSVAALLLAQWFFNSVRNEQRRRQRFERDWKHFLEQRPHDRDLSQNKNIRTRAYRYWKDLDESNF